jgi:hypothetical protein
MPCHAMLCYAMLCCAVRTQRGQQQSLQRTCAHLEPTTQLDRSPGRLSDQTCGCRVVGVPKNTLSPSKQNTAWLCDRTASQIQGTPSCNCQKARCIAHVLVRKGGG